MAKNKACTRCCELKPMTEFHVKRLRTDGHETRCRTCISDIRRSRRGGEHRRLHLQKNFGLTLEEYFEMWLDQGGACAICGKPETAVIKGTPSLLSVDHDHKTGKVRALLCRGCNGGLGSFRDNPNALRNAADYLNTFGGA